MGIMVQKYGGSSVANVERIQHVAQRVVENRRKGNDMIVVVSAMGDTTDELIEKAAQINPHPSSREMDMLLSTGEQISISLLAMAIEAAGEPVISLTGGMSGILTDTAHKKARIASIDPTRVLKELADGKIVIVAGFQGVTKDWNITTLGRGGSDTTAVALAAAVKADLCEIYTDVEGVFTADPRKVPHASQLPEISYDEMLELAKLGAQVLHPRSVELARKHDVPLVVRSTFSDHPGTRVVEVNRMEQVLVRGVTLDNNIARIAVANVPDQPGIAFGLFKKLADHHITIDMIIQNLNHAAKNDISFTVALDDLHEAAQVSREYLNEIGGQGEVLEKENVSKISIVGTGITGNAEVASKLFGTLFDLGINIEMISTSEIKISCIIDSEKCDEALRQLHTAFALDRLDIV
ncbi:aspartate kinase [Acidaminobacter hydrogenoformans DSM 2784]|uniref:Aspartokinase n=2 Tax=Acidaminobacter TaxID=65402 RepID=A0A1G5S7Y8_9FIRM|nr:aspartate kinase [Acidaminobacter hydrogenoformans DSM 2784]